MKRVILVIWLLICGLWLPSRANNEPYELPPQLLDNYDISFGPRLYACLGEPHLLVPINISVSQPTILIKLIISFDQTVLTPNVVAPNMFFQSFTYDLSQQGLIKLSLRTDLYPPPVIPPIRGDTTFAWLDFRVTTRDLLFDYLTEFDYQEDPTTPGPDNFIVLADNNIIAAPRLGLHLGEALLYHPLYGDINLNRFPWEIGDGVLFLNFFNGIAELNQCQLANADCNRDGFQATIADLVFFLHRLTYDSLLVNDRQLLPMGSSFWQPSGGASKLRQISPSDRGYDIMVQSEVPLGGASFEITLGDNAERLDAVVLDSAADYMQMYCYVRDNRLRVSVVNWDEANGSFAQGRLFSLHFASGVSVEDPPFCIESADFSDNVGQRISAQFQVGGTLSIGEVKSQENILAISGYPNPFKGTTAINFAVPNDGQYKLTVYDILGRKVKTLVDGYCPAGPGQIIWDGRDDAGGDIASGTYFARLQGDKKTHIAKLYFLK